jgi:hypothetical protein
MMVPMATPASLRIALLLAMTLLPPATLLGRGLQPAITIPLDPLGYEPLSTQFMLAGSSMLTVHFVDEQHLLLTYNTKRLLKRMADCPPEDEDRGIDALLLELPSGKVLARTEWRVHDRGQYLWNLGHGRFMLRLRNTLTTFAPLVNLASGHPFAERPIVTTRRRIQAILLSPDADLMIVESTEPKPTLASDSRRSSDDDSSQDPVQVDFFRVGALEGSDDSVTLRRAGQIFARGTGRIPANSAGYVAIIDQGRQHWAFDFRAYTGKVKELSPFESSCRPTPILVSRSEFIAFGCHQGHTQQVIGGFNLRGEEMWEQNLSDTYIAPMFVFAPAGGRFAMSRLISHDPFLREESLSPQLVGPQTVTVYQTDSGKQILRIDCSPIERAGQNFSLSPDGLSLAVIRNEAIEIYSLPPLTVEEKKAVQLAKASAPEETDAAVHFAQAAAADAATPVDQPESVTPASSNASTGSPAAVGNNSAAPNQSAPQGPAQSLPAATSSGTGSPLPAASKEKPSETSLQQPETEGKADSSSDDQTGQRKPPTIYTLPQDKGGAASTEDKKQPK